MLAWLCLKALDAILRCDRALFCAGVCISVLMTGCSPPCPPEVWKFEGPPASFVRLFVPLSPIDLDTACFRGRGRGCNWFLSPLRFCLWLSGHGRVSAPKNRWLKWQRMKLIARSGCADRWSNLTSSAPDWSAECGGEHVNWLVKGSLLYIRADSCELWEAGLMREIRACGQRRWKGPQPKYDSILKTWRSAGWTATQPQTNRFIPLEIEFASSAAASCWDVQQHVLEFVRVIVTATSSWTPFAWHCGQLI